MTDPLVRILGLDIGSERVGVAISDPLGITAQPLATLARRPETTFLDRLGEVLVQWEVQEVVVGWPVSLKGEHGGRAIEAVRGILGEMKTRWPAIRWKEWDERFTTRQATAILSSFPKKIREQKGMRDQIAAQIILSAYLASRT